jgi:hypothetical protein
VSEEYKSSSVVDVSAKIDGLRQEAASWAESGPYQAVNGLWVVLVKAANLLPRVGEEHEQIASLLRRFDRAEAQAVLSTEGVDALLDLDPPLETALAEAGERLQAIQARHELGRVRQRRSSDPKAALGSLFEIAQRIRDKREHGFKTPKGPRDSTILSAASLILRSMVQVSGCPVWCPGCVSP